MMMHPISNSWNREFFSNRTSCRKLANNQQRVLFAALGYCLTERLRAQALQGTGAGHCPCRCAASSCNRSPPWSRAKHAPNPPLSGLQLAQRGSIRARHEPASLTIIGLSSAWPAR